ISADGRLVVFQSPSDDLVLHDTNQASDVFLRDRKLGTTTRISVGPADVEGDKESYRCALSADGRFAGFTSDATTLVGDDHNTSQDGFVRGPLR
ncbi:MAG TPA: hypothetical protein VMJ49_11520, partial [Gaiellaceae bacterium]|nr:hypothetical protein [Gaiellaceae bacterium]